MIKKLAMGSFLLFAFALVGCGAVETHVAFYLEERWDAKMGITLTASEIATLGGEAVLESELKKEMTKYKARGIEYSWNKSHGSDGSTTYNLSLNGRGWDALNELVFNNSARIYTDTSPGQRRIHFSYYGSGYRSFTLHLTGGRIISSNADETKGGTAIWYNVIGSAEAVLTEASPVDVIGKVLIGLAVIGVILGAGILFRTRRRGRMPSFQTCPQCGAQNNASAKFCMRCGQPL